MNKEILDKLTEFIDKIKYDTATRNEYQEYYDLLVECGISEDDIIHRLKDDGIKRITDLLDFRKSTDKHRAERIKGVIIYLVGIGKGVLAHWSGRKMPEQKTVRCCLCGTEFSDDELKESIKCPDCGTKALPCSIADDVNIKINWHELRLLVIWAENWARQCDAGENAPEESMLLSIMTIAERLQRQFPNKTPVTLFSEIRDLRKHYNIETDIDDDSLLNLD